MKLQKLRYFVHVAELKSFSKAASVLLVSQPSLSRQIHDLEIELDVKLLHRNGRGVEPTVAGEILLRNARTILSQVEHARAEILDHKQSPSGKVRLGVPPSMSGRIATRLGVTGRRKFPDIELQIVEGWSGFIREWVTLGRVDVAILYSTQMGADLEWQPLLTEDVCVIGSRGSEVMTRDRFAIGDVAALPLIVPARPHGMRLVIDRHFDHLGLAPSIEQETEVWSVFKETLADGLCFTLLAPSEVQDEINRGTLVARPIAVPGLTRTICVARSSHRRATRAVDAIFRLVQSETKLSAEMGQWGW